MSTRLGWAGPGGGREKEERILHPGPRPAQASVPWAPTVSRPPPMPLSAFCLPSTHLASMKLRLTGVWPAGLYLDKEPSLWELNTPPSLGPYLVIYGRVEWKWGSLWGVGMWAGLRSADFLGCRIGWRNEGVYG